MEYKFIGDIDFRGITRKILLDMNSARLISLTQFLHIGRSFMQTPFFFFPDFDRLAISQVNSRPKIIAGVSTRFFLGYFCKNCSILLFFFMFLCQRAFSCEGLLLLFCFPFVCFDFVFVFVFLLFLLFPYF